MTATTRTFIMYVVAFLLIQPFMFIVDMLIVGGVFGAGSARRMLRWSLVPGGFGLIVLLFLLAVDRPLLVRRPFMAQIPIGLTLAPAYIVLFWILL